MKTVIGTHDGIFHADEVFACAALELWLQRYDLNHEVFVIRTRKQELLGSCHAVVDVGGLYDPQALRFDHHQRDKPAPRTMRQ